MTKKTKEPDAVALARKAADDKLAELTVAREAAKRLEIEYHAASVAIRRAQEEADSQMPQCDRVQINWRSGKAVSSVAVVIVRKTPGGQLVVRRVGNEAHDKDRFKWSPHARKYLRTERGNGFLSDTVELRRVPAEFLPEEPARD